MLLRLARTQAMALPSITKAQVRLKKKTRATLPAATHGATAHRRKLVPPLAKQLAEEQARARSVAPFFLCSALFAHIPVPVDRQENNCWPAAPSWP
eukprot:scaffold14258_cov73-Isochrysis_galbana.AAC.1